MLIAIANKRQARNCQHRICEEIYILIIQNSCSTGINLILLIKQEEQVTYSNQLFEDFGDQLNIEALSTKMLHWIFNIGLYLPPGRDVLELSGVLRVILIGG
jgi:hypothetical protein